MPPHLLTIPREIQDQILSYCLLVDGEINPYPTSYDIEDGFEKKFPTVALMGVNKALRACAAPILYGKNTWVISDDFDYDRYENGITGWIRPLSYLRHVRLPFDYRAHNSSSMLAISRNASGTYHEHLTPAKRAEMIHDRRYATAKQDWWNALVDFLWCGLQPPLTILLDFSNAYCPSGCCRVVESIIRNLNELQDDDHDLITADDFRITAVGLLSEEEERCMHRLHAYRCDQCVGPKDDFRRTSCLRSLSPRSPSQEV